MAKFGYLYLNKGKWEGEQIVPREWFEESTRAQMSASSHISFCDYGYQWWIYPDLGAFAALGWSGQQIFVIPDHQLVVVLTGYNLEFVTHCVNLIRNYIIPADNLGLIEFNRITLLVLVIPLAIIIWRRRTSKT